MEPNEQTDNTSNEPRPSAVLKLEPTTDQFGQLRDAQAGGIVAHRDLTRAVHVEVYNPVVVHGQAKLPPGVTAQVRAATLLVFSINPTSEHDYKRIKNCTIRFEFCDTASELAKNAPCIVDIAPDSGGLRWDESTEDWVNTKTWELHAKAASGFGGVTAEGGVNSVVKEVVKKMVTFAAKISSSRSRSKDKDGRIPYAANVAVLHVCENTSQGGGIPGIIRFALLLSRPNESSGFSCNVSIQANVDWPTNTTNALLSAFSPQHSTILYDIKQGACSEGQAIDTSRLEIFTDFEQSQELKKLASVKRPQRLQG